MNTYDLIPQVSKMLDNIGSWLSKAEQCAEQKKFDVNTLLSARLAPDQFALARQIQTACDNAKFAAARLTGREAPKHADTETTVAELKARIAEVVKYLATFTPEDFAASDTRRVRLPFFEGKSFSGSQYAMEFLLPNFYFHAAHAYAILRHNGVDVGKQDFVGSLPLTDD